MRVRDNEVRLYDVTQTRTQSRNTALPRRDRIRVRFQGDTFIVVIFVKCSVVFHFITKTCLYNFDPLKPHFYIVKLGFTGVYIIFFISAQNIDCGYLLEPPRQDGSNEYPPSMFWAEIWKLSEFFIWNFSVFWSWNIPYIWIGVFS